MKKLWAGTWEGSDRRQQVPLPRGEAEVPERILQTHQGRRISKSPHYCSGF